MPKLEDDDKKNRIKAFLKSFESGATFDASCKSAGVARTSIWNWRKQDVELDEQIKTIRNARTQVMEDALFQSGIKGNVVAQIFWLKNRGGGEWKDKQEIEHSGKLELNEEETNKLIELAERAIRELRNDNQDNKEDG